MTKDEKSLLVFFETRVVDYSGGVNTQYMNPTDMEIAKKWNESGFCKFGRISSEFISGDAPKVQRGTHWCKLSDDAFETAHKLRKLRADRGWTNRSWTTTDEKRAE